MADFPRLVWRLAALALIVLLVVAHYGLAFRFALGTFFWDDYSLLHYLVSLHHEDLSGAFRETFAQQNEHRIGLPRLLTLLVQRSFGHLDWYVLNALANLSALGIGWLGLRVLHRLGLSVVYAVPVAFFLFQPQYYENVFWTISVLQQLVILFLALLVMSLLPRPSTGSFAWALGLTFMATFSNGNGMFIFLAGLPVLLAQRRWRHLGVWAGVMVASIALYFYGLQQGQNANFAGSLSDPLRLLGGLFVFLGAFTDAFAAANTTAALLGGLVLVGGLTVFSGWVFWLSFSRHRPTPTSDDFFIVGSFVFLALTAAAATLSRSWAGWEVLMASRYQHYTAITLMLAYLALVRTTAPTPRRWVVAGSTVLGSLFCFFSYTTYTERVVEFYQRTSAETFNWRHNGHFVSYPPFMNLSMRATVDEAVGRGIQRFPRPAFTAFETRLLLPPDTARLVPVALRLNRVSGMIGNESRPFLRVEADSLPPAPGKPDGGTYLVLKSDRHTYLMATHQRTAGRRTLLRTGRFWADGFHADVLLQSLPSGTYRVGLYRYDGSGHSLVYTRYVITV